MGNPQRHLSTYEEIETFLRDVLDLKGKSIMPMVQNIFAEEAKIIAASGKKQTYNSNSFRVKDYKDDETRESLRIRIVKELLTKRRINEAKIKLGRGGCLPLTEVKKEKKFYFLIGLPASGKSTISERIADLTGSVMVDADIIKRKLPEYSNNSEAAYLTHLESQYMARPSDDLPFCDYNLMSQCLVLGYNIIYNAIGSNYEEVVEMISSIQNEHGYEVNLILVELDRKKATIRAYERYKKNKRYLPLSMIFDKYANNPTISYFKCIENKDVRNYAHISTDVSMEQPYILVDSNMSFIDFKNVLEKKVK